MNPWAEQVVSTAKRHPGMVDAALVAVLLVVGLALALVQLSWVSRRPDGLPPASIVLAATGTVAAVIPIAWRRRAPLTVFMVVAAVHTVFVVAFQVINQVIMVSIWLAGWSAIVYGAQRWRAPVVVVAFGAVWAANIYRAIVNGPPQGGDFKLDLEVLNLHWPVWLALAYTLGHHVRIGHLREAELEVRTVQLATEREANARRAVLEERVRVARELHDVIAHHVSLMGIQAAAAGRILTTRPEQAATALVSIEGCSRQAVGELHRMLGFLRQDDEDDLLAPTPGLDRLNGLITQLPDGDLAVEVHVEGDRRPLPASVDLSAYRVVQEALTNTLKHAEATTAAVTLRYRDAIFEVEVVDNGVGTAVARAGDGRQHHGLIGMRERVVLHRGEFEAGPRSEGGFGVRASFSLGKRS